MTGLLIALVVIQSLSLLVQISHAGATRQLLNRRVAAPPDPASTVVPTTTGCATNGGAGRPK